MTRDHSAPLAICPACRAAVNVFESASTGSCPSCGVAYDPDDRDDQPRAAP